MPKKQKKPIKCVHCGWTWIPRVAKPVKCPNMACQRYDYDKKGK